MLDQAFELRLIFKNCFLEAKKNKFVPQSNYLKSIFEKNTIRNTF